MIERTSLWDIMKPFDPSLFLGLNALLGYLSGADHVLKNMPGADPKGGLLLADHKKNYLIYFQVLHQECIRLDLAMSGKTAKRLVDKLSQDTVTHADPVALSDEFKLRLTDEIQLRVFYSIEPSKQWLLSDENIISSSVADSFPSAVRDIRDAAHCLAFDCWIASVFHSMRVLEIGLNALARNLGVPCDPKNWEPLIRDIETKIAEIDKTLTKEERLTIGKFNAGAAAQFRYFKNAWRNHVVHVRDTYDEADADKVFRSVNDFMIHLATELKGDRV